MSPEKYVNDYMDSHADSNATTVVIHVILQRVDKPDSIQHMSVEAIEEGNYNLTPTDYSQISLADIRDELVGEIVKRALVNFKKHGSSWYMRGWEEMYQKGEATVLTFFTETRTVAFSPPLSSKAVA